MRVYLTKAEQHAIHLARNQYEESARKYAEIGRLDTATEHNKLAKTLVGVLAKANYYPPPVTAAR